MRTRTGILCALVLLAPAIAPAQFDFGGGSSGPAWSSFNLNPKTTVKLDFKNASVDMVLSLYQKLSGVTIVKDPSLTGGITVTSAKPVSLDEAFQILSTVLSLKGYDLRKDGNLLVVRSRNQGRGGQGGGQQPGGGNPFGNFNPEMLQGMMGGGSELRVYPIKFANATQVARVVNESFAGTQDPLQQLMQQFAGMQGGQFNRFGGNNQGGRNNNNNNRFGGMNPMMFGRGGQQQVVRASADDFSNSVIVNAPSREQGQVKNLIDQIDKQTEQPLKPQVFKLQYASSDELAPVVQNVLVSNAPRGRGGIGTQNVPIEQRFQQAMRFGSTQAAFGTVVSEPRTNSLIVSATEDNLVLVAAVIEELDKEVTYENSTFVFPLSNARADQMATLLNQAFGTRQGAGGGNNRGTGANNRATTNRQPNNNNRNNTGNRNNPGGGNLGGGIRRSPDDDYDPTKELGIDLDDPEALAGELQTNINVAQGGAFGQFGGQRMPTRQGTGAQTDRDQEGRLVNVRDLTNQVTVIPDPNTNSLIVVTTPGNLDILRGILEQLDRIPEQVMIETVIVEATLDNTSKLGVEWSFVQGKVLNSSGTTGQGSTEFGIGAADPGFRYTVAGANFTAFMNALKTDQKFEVLSTPRIFTSNNVQAQINISQRVPYVVSQREDANGNLTFNYSFTDVGIVLTVTPRITANGQVTMDINQTANDLQGFTSFNAPIINQREADTTVSVRDGETIILGGIIRNTVTSTTRKVPLLGDIPILGNLFKSSEKTKAKTELLVFLTPRVVRTPEEAQRLREEQESGLSPQGRKTIEKNVPPPIKGDGDGSRG